MIMKSFHILLFILWVTVFSFIAHSQTNIPVITYFPPDDEIYFTNNTNTLTYANNTLTWNISSSTNQKTYVRQDVSLLYKDGVFKGYMNIWESKGQQLHIHKDFTNPQSGLYQSISFHYSEFHRNQDIFSTAEMNGVSLQLDCNKTSCSESDSTLSPFMSKMPPIQTHWNELITYFNLEKSDYTIIALTELEKYANSPLLSFTQEDTDAIILHLWEGLYANYIVEIMNTREQKGHITCP